MYVYVRVGEEGWGGRGRVERIYVCICVSVEGGGGRGGVGEDDDVSCHL